MLDEGPLSSDWYFLEEENSLDTETHKANIPGQQAELSSEAGSQGILATISFHQEQAGKDPPPSSERTWPC